MMRKTGLMMMKRKNNTGRNNIQGNGTWINTSPEKLKYRKSLSISGPHFIFRVWEVIGKYLATDDNKICFQANDRTDSGQKLSCANLVIHSPLQLFHKYFGGSAMCPTLY
jgi:hypothetical protein